MKDMCSLLYDNIAMLKEDYDACNVTCAGKVEAEAARHDHTIATYLKQGAYDAACAQDSHAIETEKDCEHAAASLQDTADAAAKTRPFKSIRMQNRPAGCYYFRKKVWWNRVRTGSGPKRYRIPICAIAPTETGTAETTGSATTEEPEES